jgi:hypothetical protein
VRGGRRESFKSSTHISLTPPFIMTFSITTGLLTAGLRENSSVIVNSINGWTKGLTSG